MNKEESTVTDFQKWWNEFPKGDGFKYKGRSFKRTRALRVDEVKCERKLIKILTEKNLTVEKMIEALQKEIKDRMDRSIGFGENQLTFMNNSYTYLNKGMYEAWMDEDEPEIEEENNNLINPKDLF